VPLAPPAAPNAAAPNSLTLFALAPAPRLSGALGTFAEEKEVVENIHGVRKTFLDIGSDLARSGTAALPNKVYFIGKMLYSKGLNSLIDLLAFARDSADLDIRVDM
jgi:digalactosyldiacylglycerol synthase